MKLHPKKAAFCPACGNSLSLNKTPQLIFPAEVKKEEAKVITIIGKPQKKTSVSLF